MSNTKETMTPESPRWNEFCTKLDAQIVEHGCDAKTLRQSRGILEEMGFDVADSLAEFRQEGGDCEVLFNVDR